MRVGVMGMWHLGCVTAGCLAKLGHEVTCFDYNGSVIDDLKAGRLPIFEPGLDPLFTEEGIEFTLDIKEFMQGLDIVVIAHDTKVNKDDSLDMGLFDQTLKGIIPLLQLKTTLIISSQIPVGTCDTVLDKLKEVGKCNSLCYVPENLRLGTAISSFMKPERIVIGASSKKAKEAASSLFEGIRCKKIFMDLRSAEMSKHALNAYLATMISFSGEISNMCERVGANAIKVMEALKADRRVSESAPINPGLGFGGGTLARDVQVLREIGRKEGVKTALLDSVMSINRERMHYVPQRVSDILGGLDNKTLTFFGLTYKANTNTLRRSLTLDVIDHMRTDILTIHAYDPAIKEKIEGYEQVNVFTSAEDATRDSDIIIIMTEWDEFRSLDYKKLTALMRRPFILDTKNMLEPERFSGSGIMYFGVGTSPEN